MKKCLLTCLKWGQLLKIHLLIFCLYLTHLGHPLLVMAQEKVIDTQDEDAILINMDNIVLREEEMAEETNGKKMKEPSSPFMDILPVEIKNHIFSKLDNETLLKFNRTFSSRQLVSLPEIMPLIHQTVSKNFKQQTLELYRQTGDEMTRKLTKSIRKKVMKYFLNEKRYNNLSVQEVIEKKQQEMKFKKDLLDFLKNEKINEKNILQLLMNGQFEEVLKDQVQDYFQCKKMVQEDVKNQHRNNMVYNIGCNGLYISVGMVVVVNLVLLAISYILTKHYCPQGFVEASQFNQSLLNDLILSNNGTSTLDRYECLTPDGTRTDPPTLAQKEPMGQRMYGEHGWKIDGAVSGLIIGGFLTTVFVGIYLKQKSVNLRRNILPQIPDKEYELGQLLSEKFPFIPEIKDLYQLKCD